MKKADFQNLITEQFTALQTLTATKGEEYAGAGNDDQHANFNRQAEKLGMPPEKVLMVYLSKHQDAIDNYVRTGAALSEPIEGRIDDAILYLLLLKAMIRDRTVIATAAGRNFNPC